MNYNVTLTLSAACKMVCSVCTNELQRKKLEKYLTNSKVRLVRTNELQRLCRIDATNRDWCIPCAPMNHNDILHHRYDL